MAAEPRPLCAEVVALAYDLTATQARIAVEIANGRSVQATAAELGVGLPTVRSHLRGVYEKIGINRQAELVKLDQVSELGLTVELSERIALNYIWLTGRGYEP